ENHPMTLTSERLWTVADETAGVADTEKHFGKRSESLVKTLGGSYDIPNRQLCLKLCSCGVSSER
ncbi:hypothetical protein AVEN_30901-1, partial [Araneus ventricosus]